MSELRERLKVIVREPHRRYQSNRSLARELGCCSYGTIYSVRKELGLVPPYVVYRLGDLEVRLEVGHRQRQRRRLTERQKGLIAEATPMALRMARRCANEVVAEDRLTDVALDALIVAAKHWRKRLGPKWKAYAYYGVRRAFARCFSKARLKLARLRRLELTQDPAAPNLSDGMVGRLNELTGLPRLMGEWVAGLDGAKPRTRKQLARFWGVSEEKLDEIIAITAKALQE